MALVDNPKPRPDATLTDAINAMCRLAEDAQNECDYEAVEKWWGLAQGLETLASRPDAGEPDFGGFDFDRKLPTVRPDGAALITTWRKDAAYMNKHPRKAAKSADVLALCADQLERTLASSTLAADSGWVRVEDEFSLPGKRCICWVFFLGQVHLAQWTGGRWLDRDGTGLCGVSHYRIVPIPSPPTDSEGSNA